MGPVELRVDEVPERRQQVDRAHVVVVHAAAVLAGRLDEHRHRRDLLEVRPRDEAVVGHPHLERDAVVGRYGNQRTVVEPGLVQPRKQPAELVVHEARLEQVARVVVLHEPRVAEADRLVDAFDRIVA